MFLRHSVNSPQFIAFRDAVRAVELPLNRDLLNFTRDDFSNSYYESHDSIGQYLTDYDMLSWCASLQSATQFVQTNTMTLRRAPDKIYVTRQKVQSSMFWYRNLLDLCVKNRCGDIAEVLQKIDFVQDKKM